MIESKSKFILDCFSEFHARVIEQSIISYVKPEINSCTTPVSFTFPGIDIESYTPSVYDKSHAITVYTEDGVEYNTYNSIRTARRALGIPEGTLTNARNRLNYFVHCPIPNLSLSIFDHTLNTMLDTPLSSHQKLVPITGVALDNIPYGIIRAICEDKIEVYGDYKSSTEFANVHGLNP